MHIYQGKVNPQSKIYPNQKINQQVEFVDNRGNQQTILKNIIQRQPCRVVQARSIFKFNETPDGKGRASKIHAEIYSPDTKFDGGIPKVNPIGWNWLSDHARKTNWVRFHILNQFLGGSGRCKANLIPTNKKANNGTQWREYEDKLKEEAAKNLVIYDAQIPGYHDFPGEPVHGFPTGIEARAEIQNPDTKEPLRYIPESGLEIMPLASPSPSEGLNLGERELKLLDVIEKESPNARKARLRRVYLNLALNKRIVEIVNGNQDLNKISWRRIFDLVRHIQDIRSSPEVYGSFVPIAENALRCIIEYYPSYRRTCPI